MKNGEPANRVFMVGYFVGKEDKMAFVDLLPDRDIYFLESSVKVKGGGNIIKVPQRLSNVKVISTIRHFFKKPKVNADTRSLFRRDLVAYYSNVRTPYRSISKERALVSKPFVMTLYCWNIFQKAYKSRLCRQAVAPSFVLASFDLFKKFSLRDALDFDTTREVRSMLLKITFVAGLNYYTAIIKKIGPRAGDIFLSWGCQYSGNLFLDLLLDNTGADRRILEYGEVPGTVSVNKDGIFGLSDIAADWDAFRRLKIDDEGRSITRSVLADISFRDAASRGGSNGLFDIYRNMFNLNPDRKKIIYVNGSELIASGHIYDSSLIGPKRLSPNAYLLQKACQTFDSRDHIVIYKDHPMTLRQSKALALDKSGFPGVVFVNDLNMKTLLELADVVVTFPSKVVMTSLMMRVKTIVIGRFTIPHAHSKMGLYDELALSNPEKMEQSIDYSEYIDFVTRMLKYKLIKSDNILFSDLNSEVEQSKLNAILNIDLRA